MGQQPKAPKRHQHLRQKLPVKLLVTIAVVLLIFVVLAIIFWQPLMDLVRSPERLRQLVEQAGVFGPLVFITVQFLQILIAPIPGQVVGVASGALFGIWLGTLYSLIGSVLGMFAVIGISRKLGRPFVERFVDRNTLEKFDYLVSNNGAMVFFLIMLLPVFPDDLICYIAGLSKVKVRTLVLFGALGRLPTTLVSAIIGAGVAGADIPLITGSVGVTVVVFALGYWQRKRLKRWMERFAKEHDGEKTTDKK